MRAIYPGSFDPFTFGHLDIVQRALSLFDEVTILLAHSMYKEFLLTMEERLLLIQELFTENIHVKVAMAPNLTVNYAQQENINYIIRGIRPIGDFAHEFTYAQNNLDIGNIQTIFLLANKNYYFLSSSLVKELIKNKTDVSKFIPANINNYLQKKFY